MKKSSRVLMVSIFVVLSGILLISVSFGIEFPVKEQPTTPTGPRPGSNIDPSKLLLDLCNIPKNNIGIKMVSDSPNLRKFAVTYYIPTTSPCDKRAYFIRAYLPNKASQNTNFKVTPAGLPGGIPKGDRSISDNITFEVKYNGTQTITTPSIEVEFYNDKGQVIQSTTFNVSYTWSPPAEPCRIDGLKEIQSSPNVLLQVAYYIPASWTGAYYIHGHVPNNTNRNQNILDRAAGTDTNGVPKGQQSFTNNVLIDLGYNGSQQLTTSTIEILISDSPTGGKMYCSKILPWTHTWNP